MRDGYDLFSFLALGLLLVVGGCTTLRSASPGAASERSSNPSPEGVAPVAGREPSQTTVHGVVVKDDYAWLRGRGEQRVLDYLEAENRYTDGKMRHTRELQEKLFQEMLGRIQEDDSDPPYRHGDYFYYSRTEKGRSYPFHCRRRAGVEGAAEEVLLDVNALAEGHEFFELGAVAVSPDHAYLAYGFDTEGSEEFTVVVKELASGELLSDRIEATAASLEWANDNATLFYTVQDAARRPFQVFRHRLGNRQELDELVFEELDESFFVGLRKTRSEQYLLVELGSSTTSEVHYLDADRPDDDFTLFAERRHEVEYDLSHCGEHFYVRTNEGAKNFRLARTRVTETAADAWQEVLPHRLDTKLEWVDCFESFIVLRERVEGQRKIRIRDYDGRDDHHVELPETVYSVGFSDNAEYESDRYRFTYTSLVTPSTVYEYRPHARQLELLKRDEVLGGYNPANYVTERIFAKAEDGTRVPMSVVYRRGLIKDSSHPCLLHAYGSYGATTDPRFSSLNLTLLDRGFVYAIAHVRGGGFLGETWHDAGKMLDKRNTFTDFIAAAERLLEGGYTSTDRLAARGGSAGGLLMGAVANMAPDTFVAIVAHVPFVDVINTMLDETIPLTVIEWEEWGNPNEEEYFDYMLSYSPYDNVEAKEYPDLLVTAGLNDPRVQYWEPAKWVAKLRATKTGDQILLLKTNMGAGHSGASGRYGFLREKAFEYAFLFDRLGIEF